MTQNAFPGVCVCVYMYLLFPKHSEKILAAAALIMTPYTFVFMMAAFPIRLSLYFHFVFFSFHTRFIISDDELFGMCVFRILSN